MAPLDHELPRTLDGLVGQLYSGGGHALSDHSALKELLELTDTASFTPRVAVHLLVTCNLAFVPLQCTEIKRLTGEGEEQREWAHNSVERGAALVWCVCLLKRLVENLVDKERELYKVSTFLKANDMFQYFTQLIDGPEEEAGLPGRAEEGELRSWVMVIIRWCFHYDKTSQLGKVESLYAAHNELFNIGFYAKVVQIFGAGPVTDSTRVAATLLQSVADCPKTKFREKLRKSGVIMLASSRLAGDPNFRMCSILLYNMSRSVSTHNSLRDADLLAAAQKLLAANESMGPATDPVVLLSLTLAVANVYGTDTENAEEAEAFLSEQQVSAEVVRMMRNALSGLDGIPHVQDWDVSGEEVAFMAFCLSQHATFNRQMVDAGLLDAIKQMLEQGEEGTLPCVRTLLSLSYSPELGEAIRSAKMTEKLVELTRSEDMRVSDAAKACLTELGLDMQRNIFDSKSIQRRHDTDRLAGIAEFNVFLSHRRADSKDFARALFNLLTQRGYTTYLDFEYLKELKDLREAVSRCQNFIFILSDHIFDSFWCKEELMTAVRSGCNIILVVKEGSKWVNTDGQDVYEFPPPNLIGALPEEAQRVFSNNVAIKHSDEYYQSFVEKVMGRLVPPKEQRPGSQLSEALADSANRPVVTGNKVDRNAGSGIIPKPSSQSRLSDSGNGDNNTQYNSQLIDTQLMFTHATERMQASFVEMYTKMQTHLVQSNVSELASVRQALSGDLTNMQRQVASEVAHMRQHVTTEILEVRREMAAEMTQMKSALNEVRGSLQDLTKGAQQSRTHTHSQPGDVPHLLVGASEDSHVAAPSSHPSSTGEHSRSLTAVGDSSAGRMYVYPDLTPSGETRKGTQRDQQHHQQQGGTHERGSARHGKANYTRRERTVLPELPHATGKTKLPTERRMMQYTFQNGERGGR